MPITPSPLRYPGGKTQLYPIVRDILRTNGMEGITYAEPFAGGCGLALKLLFKGDVGHIVLNDFDVAIYAFWFSILNYTDEFFSMLANVPVTVEEWEKQKEIYSSLNLNDLLALGFATFFLNRTNVSGVIKGGLIGGKKQNGNFKLDARFVKESLFTRIRKISEYRNNISLYNLDAMDFIDKELSKFKKLFINFDPPYVKKGSSLYKNAYSEDEHRLLSRKISLCNMPWIVTYDACSLVKKLYAGFRESTLGISYSIGNTRNAKEYIYFSDCLKVPANIFTEVSS